MCPRCSVPDGYGSMLEDVALARSAEPASGIGHDPRLLVLPDALPLRSRSARVVSAPSGLRVQKSLSLWRGSREARRGAAAVAPCATEEAASLRLMLPLFPETASIAAGELAVGGVPASALAERFGTPLVVYCERTLRERARLLRRAAGDATVVYGTKAFANVALLRLLAEEGLGADVSTLGELAFARAAGLERRPAGRPRQQQVRRGAAARGRARRARRARCARRARARRGGRRLARADPRHSGCRRGHARGDPNRPPRLEVRSRPGPGARRSRTRAQAAGLAVEGLPRARGVAARRCAGTRARDRAARGARRALPR